jgi:hypothetical protein
MSHRGRDTLRFGPMKPVGLVDPRTGREPYAAVQLRQDNLAGDHFSLVGFQTQIKWGDQARVLRMIPGLEQAEFVRFGMVHRNTYVNGPTVLTETWQVKKHPTLFFAGQMSGVEGYVESAASGLLAGLNAAALSKGEAVSAAPRTTAIGGISRAPMPAVIVCTVQSMLDGGRADTNGAGCSSAVPDHGSRLMLAGKPIWRECNWNSGCYQGLMRNRNTYFGVGADFENFAMGSFAARGSGSGIAR